MSYYPIFLDLDNKKVIVVGGGDVAERKIKVLLSYGCKIFIISPHLTPYLRQLVAKRRLQHISHEPSDRFTPLEKKPRHLWQDEKTNKSEHGLKSCSNLLMGSMDDAVMVIAATGDPEVNLHIASQAKGHGLLVNVVDQPAECNFIMPSIVKRGDLQIAISTAGKSPAMAKKIRREMEALFGSEYGSLIELLGLLRIKLLSQGQSSSKNKAIFQKLADSNLLQLIKKRNMNGVRATLKSILGEGLPIEDIVKQVFRGM